MRGRRGTRPALTLLVVLFSWGGCSDLGVTPGDDIVISTATIEQAYGNDFLIHLDHEFRGMAVYDPLNLPDEFRQNGLRVKIVARFAAEPNVMYILPPLRIISIDLIGSIPRPQ